MIACPQGSVFTLPALAKHIVSQQEEREEQGLMPDGERGLTSSLPHLPCVGGGSKTVKQGHPHLVMAPVLALPDAMSSSLVLLLVSVV